MANQAWQVEYRLSIWKAMLLPSPEQTLRKPGTQEKAHRGVPAFLASLEDSRWSRIGQQPTPVRRSPALPGAGGIADGQSGRGTVVADRCPERGRSWPSGPWG